MLFEKKFKIYKRDTIEEDISTRIVNLIESFNIENPYYGDGEIKVNFDNVNDVLNKGRKHLNDFIYIYVLLGDNR